MFTLKLFFRACNVISDPFTNWISAKNITIEKDIIYDNSNPDVLRADLYYNKDITRKYPVFINIHGGGFVDGDKKFRRGFAVTMAREGFFVINVNYGLCPEYKFPYFIDNTIQALNWTILNSEKYNLDTDNIILSGDSSGSFISAVTAGSTTNEDFRNRLGLPECNATIKALLLFCGVYDFLSVMDNKGFIKKSINYSDIITGMSYNELKDLGYFKLLSPDYYVSSNYPPTFITYSTKDLLCDNTSNTLIDNLKAKGVIHEIFEATNFEDIHCFHLRPLIKNARKCLQASSEFLRKTIK